MAKSKKVTSKAKKKKISPPKSTSVVKKGKKPLLQKRAKVRKNPGSLSKLKKKY